MSCAALLDEFDACAEEGLIRRLGSAFARFIASLGEAHPCVLLTCVLLSELESSGHTCLLLDELVEDPCGRLHLSNERSQQLHALIGTFPGTVDEWAAVLTDCPQIYTVGHEDRHQPLVLDHGRLYLRRFWCDEQSVAKAVAQRTTTLRDVDAAKIRQWLQLLFPSSQTAAVHDWQKTACAIAVRSDLSIITGGPGTGKTYTVARLLVLLWALSSNPERLRIALVAPSGKAAIRLKQSIGRALAEVAGNVKDQWNELETLAHGLPAATTLHSLLGANPETRTVRHHADHPLDVDVLIVDEASMVHLEMMADLLAALPPHAMLVLLGDKDQLSSVEAGAVLSNRAIFAVKA